MDEARFKRLVTAITVGAVLLLVVLLTVMVYQLISMKVKQNEIDALDTKIASYEKMIQDGEDEYSVRKSRWFLEREARKLGYVYKDDVGANK